ETSSSVMLVSTVESTTPAPTILTALTGSTTQPVTGTTPKQCEEMQAIDGNVSKQITTSSDKLPKSENTKFEPTSTEGVSFDAQNPRPTITVHFGRFATIRSIRLPRNKTRNGNVKQFQVTLYSPDESKINDKPILSNPTSEQDESKPAELNSNQIPADKLVSSLDITIVDTTNGEYPKGVILDIQACTQVVTG
ncbi:unnamed protein product, partial [Rotaria sordida]